MAIIFHFHFLAVGQAVNLANSMVKFPQECMKADKRSAIFSIAAPSLEEALRFEHFNAIEVLEKVSMNS